MSDYILCGCDFKDCMYGNICPKNVGRYYEGKFECEKYDNEHSYLIKLGEKYMEKERK